jgi:hypothetical protein
MAQTATKTKLEQLAELLGSFGDEDLKPINDEIAALSAQLDQARQRRKTVLRLLGRPLKKSRQPAADKGPAAAPSSPDRRATGSEMLSRRRQIAMYISLKGPKSVADLAKRFGCSMPTIYAAIDGRSCEWFKKEADEVHLTIQGRRALS